MTRQHVLDLYFMDARSKLIDLAAFLDRVERAEGKRRLPAVCLSPRSEQTCRALGEESKRSLLAFSDPTPEPIPAATTKAACGAWPGSH